MTRLALIAALLLALVAPAAAHADEAFLGLLPDGRTSVRFNEGAFPAVVRGGFAGLPADERIAALGDDVLVTRSGRIFRLDRQTGRVTATPARVGVIAGDVSVFSVAGGVRVMTTTGLDETADLATGAVTRGTGLRLAGGTVVPGVFDALPDGRVAGISTLRRTLLTETAPGSGIVTEQALTTGRSTRFTALLSPSGFSISGGRGLLVTRLSLSLRTQQSRFISVDLASGAVRGESGPFLFRMLISAIPLGTARPDRTPPTVSRVRLPRTLSLRRINTRTGRFSLRCSEGCNAIASIVTGSTTSAFGAASRDDAGVVSPQLWASNREKTVLRRLVGRRLAMRIRVADFAGNRLTFERRFTLTR